MNCVVRRGVVTLAQHRPLITFPVRTPLTPVLPPPLTAAQLNQNVPVVEDANSSTRVVLDELPQRYRRRPLEDLEINYINMGGPE